MANPNTPKFPSAVAGDTDLPPLSNRWSTTLGAQLNQSATSITLITGGGTGLTTPCLVWIDSECIRIASRSGDTLTVASGGRGFDGTSDVQHAIGSAIFEGPSAHHYNQAAAETIAVETALGANLANLSASAGGRTYIYTSSGSWQVPASITKARIIAIGAGGGGAGGNSGGPNGGGGGGGGDVQEHVVTVTPSTSLTITIGTGGAGGSAGVDNAASGGNTTVSGTGVSITAPGGEKGYLNLRGGNSGGGSKGSYHGNPSARPTEEHGMSGAGAGGNTAASQYATRGSGPNQQDVWTFASTYYGGYGGGTPFGKPGKSGPGSGYGNNGEGGQYGSGGGAGSVYSGAQGTGGAGGPGLVVIYT